MKKTIAALLCLALLLSLCACRRDGGKAEEKAEPVLEADIETPFYSRELLVCPDGSKFEAFATGAGESVVISGQDGKGEHCLFRFNTQQCSFEKIACVLSCTPETLDGRSDGSAVLSYRDETGVLVVCEIGVDNSVASHPLNLPEELAETYIFDLKAVEDGYLITAYEAATPCFYIVDKEGGLLSRCAYEGYNSLSIMRGQDDRLTVACGGKDGTLFQVLDDELSVCAEYRIKTQFNGFLNGGGSGEIIAVLPLGKACVVRPETGEMRGLVNLSDSKMGWRGIVPLSEDELFCIEEGQAYIWKASDEQRIILKMQTNLAATAFLESTLRGAVNGFNSSGGKYYIELVDYSVYGEQAEQMLLADLMNGEVPDIFDLNSLKAESCYKNKLLENLKPWFDADSDVDYEAIVSALRRVTERDGGLYELIPQYTVFTLFLPESVIGEDKLTVDKLAALAEEYGTERLFGSAMTGEALLTRAVTYCDDFINTRQGICSFDSPQFIKLIEIAKLLPKEIVDGIDSEVYSGKALLYPSWMGKLGNVDGIGGVDALYRGDWRCVGFPSAEGTGVAVTPELRLAMSSSSQNKEGVWEFFKYLLSDSFQWNIPYGLPAIESILEQEMDENIENGKTCSMAVFMLDESGGYSFEALQVGPPTEKQKTQTLEILDKIDHINEQDPAIVNVILDEARRFFAGGCTAAEAAANIQSKASIYLAEQYG